MNICEHLTDTARIFPDRAALVFGQRSYSYGDLDQRSVTAAARLAALNVRPGDRVAIQLANVPAFAVWYYAVLRCGAIAVSISTRLSSEEVRFVIGDCDAKVVVQPAMTKDAYGLDRGDGTGSADNAVRCFPLHVDDEGEMTDSAVFCSDHFPADEEGKLWHDAGPDDPAVILYTSGTTGFPKGATLSHSNVRTNVSAFNHLCGMTPEAVILLTVPLFHCFGQNAILNAGLNAGATLILQQTFDPPQSRRLIADHGVTQLYGVPAMFRMLREICTPADLATVSYCFSAAAPMPLQLADAWREKYSMPIHEGYGLTETSPFASYNHRLKFVPGSIGAPVDGCEMKIVDTETGRTCTPDQPGEIAIRGPNVMLGYWNRPEETSEAIRDGWFFSGDIGRQDADGLFYIVDRVKDMISVGGLKVFPAEVERVLLDLPQVAEVAVVGVPDDVLGEQVVACVVVDRSHADGSESMDAQSVAAAVKAYSREHLANYKMPKRIDLVDALPRNPSGKVLKTVLRQQLAERAAGIAVAGTAVAGIAVAGTEAAGTESVRVGEPPKAHPAEQVTDSGVASKKPATPTSPMTPTASTAPPRLMATLQGSYVSQRHAVTVDYLQQVIAEITGDDPPEKGGRLLEAGLDSLMLVELSQQLEAEVGNATAMPATVVFDYPTIDELAGHLLTVLFDPTDDADPTDESANEADATQGIASQDIIAKGNRANQADRVNSVAAMSEEEVLDALMRELED